MFVEGQGGVPRWSRRYRVRRRRLARGWAQVASRMTLRRMVRKVATRMVPARACGGICRVMWGGSRWGWVVILV